MKYNRELGMGDEKYKWELFLRSNEWLIWIVIVLDPSESFFFLLLPNDLPVILDSGLLPDVEDFGLLVVDHVMYGVVGHEDVTERQPEIKLRYKTVVFVWTLIAFTGKRWSEEEDQNNDNDETDSQWDTSELVVSTCRWKEIGTLVLEDKVRDGDVEED